MPVLLRLIRGLAEYERLADTLEVDAEALVRDLFGDRPYAEALLAEWEGEPAGYALYFPTYSTFRGRPALYLEDLFVLPEARGRGIGLKLLAAVAAACLEHGAVRLDWAVLDWNEHARRFYERLGAYANTSWLGYRLEGEALGRLADTMDR